MRTSRIMLPSLAAFMLFAAGCRSTETPEEKDSAAEKKPAVPARFTAADDAPAHEMVGQFVAEFAAALKTGDRGKLSAETRAKVTEAMFKRMCDSFSRRRGVLRETAFVTVLDQTIMRDYLWKFTFERPLPAASAVQKNEAIFLVRVLIDNGKPKIAGFGFQE